MRTMLYDRVRKILRPALIAACLVSGESIGAATPSPDPAAGVAEFTAQIETICRNAQQGTLTEPARVTAPAAGNLLQAATLTFSLETFDRDLDKALDLLDQYAALNAERFHELDDRSAEDRLKTAEAEMGEPDPIRPEAAESFSLFDEYSRTHKERQAERDRRAEDDMRRTTEERRLAQERAAIDASTRRRMQDLNRQWQEEMDAQATREAEAEAAWRREHSAGAFMKKLAWTLAGSTLTSFTGGFAHSMGAGYADYVIRKRFPDYAPTGRYETDYYK